MRRQNNLGKRRGYEKAQGGGNEVPVGIREMQNRRKK